MLTAMLAVRNLFGERHDLWEVNADQEYHEQEARREPAVSAGIAADVGRLAGTQPSVPRSIPVKRES